MDASCGVFVEASRTDRSEHWPFVPPFARARREGCAGIALAIALSSASGPFDGDSAGTENMPKASSAVVNKDQPRSSKRGASLAQAAGRWLRDNGLCVVTLLLFMVATVGQIASGLAAHNQELVEQGRAALGLGAYLASGHFIEALFENWESEFLQMGVFVWLSAQLVQKGSAESRPIDEPFEGDEDPRKHQDDPQAPWPVRRGGWALWLYERSLVLAFLSMFLLSFALHAIGGRLRENEQRAAHGLPEESLSEFVRSSQFWFESFQNWQSEFLAMFSVIALTIFLRQRGSPQSKPVASPHSETGK
jgi:hypothetical protein